MLINRLKHMSSRQLKETFDNLSGREIKILLESKDDPDDDDDDDYDSYEEKIMYNCFGILRSTGSTTQQQIDAINALEEYDEYGDPSVIDMLLSVLTKNKAEKVRMAAAYNLADRWYRRLDQDKSKKMADILVGVIYNDSSASVAAICVRILTKMREDIVRELLQKIASDKSLKRSISKEAKEYNYIESYEIKVIDEDLLKKDYYFYKHDYPSYTMRGYQLYLFVEKDYPEGAYITAAPAKLRQRQCRDAIHYHIQNGTVMTAEEAKQWVIDHKDTLVTLEKSIKGFDYDKDADASIRNAIKDLEKTLSNRKVDLNNYLKTVRIVDIFPKAVSMSKKSFDEVISLCLARPHLTNHELEDIFEDHYRPF